MHNKPRVAVLIGDPCGIGPEITAKVLADKKHTENANVFIIADREQFLAGQKIAGVEVPFSEAGSPEEADFSQGAPVLLHHQGPQGCQYIHGQVNVESGRYCLDTLQKALEMAAKGQCDAICFAPLNKEAMHKAGMKYSDELEWFSEELGFSGPTSHINVLKELWTSRVTSHVALKDVSRHITKENVLRSVLVINDALKRSGKPEPKIAVAALNPHGGEGGLFGSEEQNEIAPAVHEAKAMGIDVVGPYPADTLFLRALNEKYDAVVTMYHDQGQIAMKLTGFDRGVTVQGGLPIAITTPAHGTALDIAGQNKANDSAMRFAFELACKMGRNLIKEKSATAA